MKECRSDLHFCLMSTIMPEKKAVSLTSNKSRKRGRGKQGRGNCFHRNTPRVQGLTPFLVKWDLYVLKYQNCGFASPWEVNAECNTSDSFPFSWKHGILSTATLGVCCNCSKPTKERATKAGPAQSEGANNIPAQGNVPPNTFWLHQKNRNTQLCCGSSFLLPPASHVTD